MNENYVLINLLVAFENIIAHCRSDCDNQRAKQISVEFLGLHLISTRGVQYMYRRIFKTKSSH